MNTPFEQLLLMADQSAASGNWEAALKPLLAAYEMDPTHVGIINGLGACFLQLDRVEEAIPWFLQVCDLSPDSPEAFGNLGVAYAFQGNLPEAERAFRTSIDVDTEHRPSWMNLSQILLQQDDRLMEGVEILAALVRADPNDVEAILLLAHCYEEGGDPSSACELYEHILSIDPRHSAAVDGLKRLRSRDIHRIASTDHLSKLAALKQQPADRYPPSSIILAARPGLAETYRLEPAAAHLREAGLTVKTAAALEPDDVVQAEVILFHDPFKGETFLPAIKASLEAGKQVIFDFTTPPLEAPLNGNRETFKHWIKQAHALTTSAPPVAKELETLHETVILLPPCWTSENPFWAKDPPTHVGVRPGLVSAYASPESMQNVAGCLQHALMQNPDSRLILIGSFEDVAHLEGVPKEGIHLLPPGDVNDFPYQLSQMDILLLPDRQHPYTMQAKMHAGILRIPWLAFGSPQSTAWEAGGIVAGDGDEWANHLLQLMDEPALRTELGRLGYEKACDYRIETAGASWKSLFS